MTLTNLLHIFQFFLKKYKDATLFRIGHHIQVSRSSLKWSLRLHTVDEDTLLGCKMLHWRGYPDVKHLARRGRSWRFFEKVISVGSNPQILLWLFDRRTFNNLAVVSLSICIDRSVINGQKTSTIGEQATWEGDGKSKKKALGIGSARFISCHMIHYRWEISTRRKSVGKLSFAGRATETRWALSHPLSSQFNRGLESCSIRGGGYQPYGIQWRVLCILFQCLWILAAYMYNTDI